MSREFDEQLKASLNRELWPAYLSDDDPRLARFSAEAARRHDFGGAGRAFSAAAPVTRLRLAALVVVGAVVIGGTAVVDASRSDRGPLLPVLQPASGSQPMEAAPSSTAPANPVIQPSDGAPANGPGGGQPGRAAVGAASGTQDHREQKTPERTDPSPSPEHDSAAPPETPEKTESVPKPDCSTPPSPSSHSSMEAPAAAPPATDGRPADRPAPEGGPQPPHQHCG